MGSNTQYVYGHEAMLKIISDPGTVSIKVCPKIEVEGDGPIEYDEVVEARTFVLNDWFSANLLLKEIRSMRDRTWGKPE